MTSEKIEITEVISEEPAPQIVFSVKVRKCPNCQATYIVPPTPHMEIDFIAVECVCGQINDYSRRGEPLFNER